MTAASVLFAYLIGSLPFALVVARWRGAPDLRRVGSGNLGATNVLRASGLFAGLLVAVLDIAKGAVSVLLAERLNGSGTTPAIAGLAAIIGHIYPVWLRLRGGKGVATACGVFAVLAPLAVPPALLVFFMSAWLTKYMSVGSVLASAVLPPTAFALGSPLPIVLSACAAAVLIVFRHRSNLVRVWLGTERRLGARA
jgi:acyl phosphate:glycerol-3-phosphate acyltransferase